MEPHDLPPPKRGSVAGEQSCWIRDSPIEYLPPRFHLRFGPRAVENEVKEDQDVTSDEDPGYETD